MLLIGVGYLLLSYLLRITTQYDGFDFRTIGYGVVFMIAGLTGLFLLPKITVKRLYPLVGVFFCGLLSVILSHGSQLPIMVTSIFKRTYVSPIKAIADYKCLTPPPLNAEIVVTFTTPSISPWIAANSDLYYRKKVVSINPETWPNGKPETLEDFTLRMRSLNVQVCVFDFTPFSTRQNFQDALDNNKLLIDVKYSTASIVPNRVYKISIDPALKNYLLRIFQPARYVPFPNLVMNSSIDQNAKYVCVQ